MLKKLGKYYIYSDSKENFIKYVVEKIKSNSKLVIISGNPEILFNSSKNGLIYPEEDGFIIIPDGIGTILAGKLTGTKFNEKIAGIEVVESLVRISKAENFKIYLLGAENWVVKKANDNIKFCFNADIVGYHDGFFDINNCDDILLEINNLSPNILFVAMGWPKQEEFILKYKDRLNCNIFMGVGGSFDVFAGKTRRAPWAMIKLGLEWLYRVFNEPKRIKRLIYIPLFIFNTIVNKKRH